MKTRKHVHAYDMYDELVEEEYCKCGDKRIRPITYTLKLPLRIIGHDDEGYLVDDKNNQSVVRLDDTSEKIAAYIVRAVNSHQELLATLKGSLDSWKQLSAMAYSQTIKLDEVTIESVRQCVREHKLAIAKAEGK